jgi:hypothetical protein
LRNRAVSFTRDRRFAGTLIRLVSAAPGADPDLNETPIQSAGLFGGREPTVVLQAGLSAMPEDSGS